MTTSAQDIMTAAFARDAMLRGEWFVTVAAEALAQLNRIVQGAFLEAADIAPTYFGQRLGVTPVAGVWARPADALVVTRIRVQSGLAPVTVVTEEDADTLGVGSRSVYEYGRAFYPCAGSLLAGTEPVYFYAATSPPLLTAMTDTLDPRWPERYNELLIIPLAQWLTRKDNRPELADTWTADLERWREQFRLLLTQTTVNVEAAHPVLATPSAPRTTTRGGDRA